MPCVLLTLICERISGQSSVAFSRERIFEPLGMSSVIINDFVPKIILCRAGLYYEDGQGGWVNVVLTDSVVGLTPRSKTWSGGTRTFTPDRSAGLPS